MATVFFEDGIIPACIPSIDDESTWPSVITPDPSSIVWNDPGPDTPLDPYDDSGVYSSQPFPVTSTKCPPSKENMIALTAEELCYIYWKIKEMNVTEADIDVTISTPKIGSSPSTGTWNFGAGSGEVGPISRTDAGDESDLVCLKLDSASQQISSDSFYGSFNETSGPWELPVDAVISPFLLGGNSGAIGNLWPWGQWDGSLYSANWHTTGGRGIPNLWYDKHDKLYYWCPGFTFDVLGPQVGVDWNSNGIYGYGAASGATVQTSPIPATSFPSGVIKSAKDIENFWRDAYPGRKKNWINGSFSYGITAAAGTLTIEFMDKQKSCPLNLCVWIKLPGNEPNPYDEWEKTTFFSEWSGTANATISEVSTWDYKK